jgi:hypothetical protein
MAKCEGQVVNKPRCRNRMCADLLTAQGAVGAQNLPAAGPAVDPGGPASVRSQRFRQGQVDQRVMPGSERLPGHRRRFQEQGTQVSGQRCLELVMIAGTIVAGALGPTTRQMLIVNRQARSLLTTGRPPGKRIVGLPTIPGNVIVGLPLP